MASIWDNQEISVDLKKLIERDHLSFTEAAAALSQKYRIRITRNCCIGRGHRIGIQTPTRSSRTVADEVNRIVMAKTRRQSRPAPEMEDLFKYVRCNGNSDTMRLLQSIKLAKPRKLECVLIEPRNVPFGDLQFGECRYPYGEDVITFCGHPAAEGKSYCVPHMAIAYKPTPARLSDEERFRRARHAAKMRAGKIARVPLEATV